MIIIVAITLLTLIFSYYFYLRRLYSSDKIETGNSKLSTNKLMIVAHPDDIIVYGATELINDNKWLVICVTNGSKKSGNVFSKVNADSKKDYFIKLMDFFKCKYEIWDYEENPINSNWNKTINSRIEKLLSVKFEKIVTHDSDDDELHCQKRKLGTIVKNFNPKNLYVFESDQSENYPKQITVNKHLETILNLLSDNPNKEFILEKNLLKIVTQRIRELNVVTQESNL